MGWKATSILHRIIRPQCLPYKPAAVDTSCVPSKPDAEKSNINSFRTIIPKS